MFLFILNQNWCKLRLIGRCLRNNLHTCLDRICPCFMLLTRDCWLMCTVSSVLMEPSNKNEMFMEATAVFNLPRGHQQRLLSRGCFLWRPTPAIVGRMEDCFEMDWSSTLRTVLAILKIANLYRDCIRDKVQSTNCNCLMSHHGIAHLDNRNDMHCFVKREMRDQCCFVAFDVYGRG